MICADIIQRELRWEAKYTLITIALQQVHPKSSGTNIFGQDRWKVLFCFVIMVFLYQYSPIIHLLPWHSLKILHKNQKGQLILLKNSDSHQEIYSPFLFWFHWVFHSWNDWINKICPRESCPKIVVRLVSCLHSVTEMCTVSHHKMIPPLLPPTSSEFPLCTRDIPQRSFFPHCLCITDNQWFYWEQWFL